MVTDACFGIRVFLMSELGSKCSFLFSYGIWRSPLARTGCLWLLGCSSAGVTLRSIVWKDTTQQEQYGFPVPEAMHGVIGPLLYVSLLIFFPCDKTNGFSQFKMLLRVFGPGTIPCLKKGPWLTNELGATAVCKHLVHERKRTMNFHSNSDSYLLHDQEKLNLWVFSSRW